VEDTKRVIRSRKSKKKSHYNGQKKNARRINIDMQNTTQKTKGQATQTPIKTGVEFRCSGRVCSSCSICGTCRVLLLYCIEAFTDIGE